MSSWRKFLTGSQESRFASLLFLTPLPPPPPPHLKQHQPPPNCPFPAPDASLLFFLTCTFLRSWSHPVENQHVAPGHKSGGVKLTCTCPVFTSSSFPPRCHSAPPTNLFSSLPPSVSWPTGSLSSVKLQKIQVFTDLLSLCPESVTRPWAGRFMRSVAPRSADTTF